MYACPHHAHTCTGAQPDTARPRSPSPDDTSDADTGPMPKTASGNHIIPAPPPLATAAPGRGGAAAEGAGVGGGAGGGGTDGPGGGGVAWQGVVAAAKEGKEAGPAAGHTNRGDSWAAPPPAAAVTAVTEAGLAAGYTNRGKYAVKAGGPSRLTRPQALGGVTVV